jgi:AcrR family transcriptional regulator
VTNLEDGRVEQKRRTRRSILQAVARMIQGGQKPTMTEVAREAGVGRATVYRYFPSLEALLLEAPLDAQHAATPEALMGGMEESGTEDRVTRVQRYLYDLAVKNEAEFRMYLRATMDAWFQRGDGDEPLRAGRRVAMLEAALAPHGSALSADDFSRLRDALATMVGIESLIVMRDVCGRSAGEGREIMEWAVRTLVAAATAGARPGSRGDGQEG